MTHLCQCDLDPAGNAKWVCAVGPEGVSARCPELWLAVVAIEGLVVQERLCHGHRQGAFQVRHALDESRTPVKGQADVLQRSRTQSMSGSYLMILRELIALQWPYLLILGELTALQLPYLLILRELIALQWPYLLILRELIALHSLSERVNYTICRNVNWFHTSCLQNITLYNVYGNDAV